MKIEKRRRERLGFQLLISTKFKLFSRLFGYLLWPGLKKEFKLSTYRVHELLQQLFDSNGLP